jgi:hypothetical protein
MNEEPTGPEDAQGEIAPSGPAFRIPSTAVQSIKLFRLTLVSLGALIAYLIYNAKVSETLQLDLGILIVVLGFLPGLLWIKRAEYHLPIFETFIATTITAYGIPLISGHEQLQYYDSATITKAAFAVVLFQLVAIMTYTAWRASPKRGRFWREDAFSGDFSKYLSYGMTLSIAYSVVDQFTDWVPDDLEGPIRAICFGFGIIATFVQSRRWGLGQLPTYARTGFIMQLTALVVLNVASLFLVQGISTLILALLGYVSASKKFPVAATIILLPIFTVLHQGKTAMRLKYWEGQAPKPTLVQLPDFFGEWFTDGLAGRPTGDAPAEKVSLLDRTSLIQILCLVVSATPERLPFINGETYAQIPGQFVPRFFWPGKPVGHVSTNTLAVYYGLQRIEDTEKTTIAFGLLAEAYSNFGLLGVSLVAFVFGGAFKKISGWAAESPILSYPGLILIVLMAWSFQDEFTLSIWLSSFYQACVVVCIVPFALNRVIH